MRNIKKGGPPNIKYARKFFDYGNLDYKAAKILFSIQDYDFMNQAAFLCAQAVEKYLKSFLFWNSTNHYPDMSGVQILNEFKRLGHDLEKNLKECEKDNDGFKYFGDKIKIINKYSLLKYPDIEDKMVYSDQGLSIDSEMITDVKSISDFVKKLIL